MLLSEILNADPELLVHVVRKLLKDGEKVWVAFIDSGLQHAPVDDIDPQPDDLFVHMNYEDEWQWFDLNPTKEWTVTKQARGWVIHAAR
jgi:hypothetical protein